MKKKRPKWMRDFDDYLVWRMKKPIEEIWKDLKAIVYTETGQISLFD